MRAYPARSWLPVGVAAGVAIGVAWLGGLMTQLDAWYYGLAKPAWNPPDWLFAPAWTVIFSLTTLAAVHAWQAAPTARVRRQLVALFLLNGILNVAWSALFFRLRRPDLALMDVALLWLSIGVLIVLVVAHSRRAAWLLVPYLGWVGFAAFLNYTVVQLNPSLQRP